MLVVCGGEATEPAYFNGLKAERRARNVTVRAKGLSPTRLVAHARKLLAHHRDEFDETWCVTDVDEYRDIPAAVRAAGTDIRLAVSNPCFELWLLMHFEDVPVGCNTYVDAQRRLRKHVPDYDKASLDYRVFAAGVDAAVRRSGVVDHVDLSSPFSGVGALVSRISDR